jgi:hypothetical protein
LTSKAFAAGMFGIATNAAVARPNAAMIAKIVNAVVLLFIITITENIQI